jgi:Domain of unknown function (DUF5078)
MLIKVTVAAAVVSVAGVALPAVAAADASDDYPIPNRILKTQCTVDQYMVAVRDVEPVYYERCMIDYNNWPPDVQQGARDRIYWFFSLDYAGRRQYSEDTATNVYYEQMATHWGNWAKLFFNNKGVAAYGHRHLHELPTQRSIGVELVRPASSSTSTAARAPGTEPDRPCTKTAGRQPDPYMNQPTMTHLARSEHEYSRRNVTGINLRYPPGLAPRTVRGRGEPGRSWVVAAHAETQRARQHRLRVGRPGR